MSLLAPQHKHVCVVESARGASEVLHTGFFSAVVGFVLIMGARFAETISSANTHLWHFFVLRKTNQILKNTQEWIYSFLCCMTNAFGNIPSVGEK